MPYITAQSRNDMRGGRPPATAGELNYLFTITILGKVQKSFPRHEWEGVFYHMMVQYFDLNGKNYQAINDIAGAVLNCCFEVAERTNDDFGFARSQLQFAYAEFYNEIARPYEDRKIAENGDVFDPIPAENLS